MGKRKVKGTSTGRDGPLGFGKVPLVLFTVLLVFSLSLFSLVGREAQTEFRAETQVDAEGILQSFLSTTVDEVRYTDDEGSISIYTGWTVQSLLIEALEIRLNTTENQKEANETSLEKGIEGRLGDILDELCGSHHYNLRAFVKDVQLRISDLDINEGIRTDGRLPLRSYSAMASVELVVTQ